MVTVSHTVIFSFWYQITKSEWCEGGCSFSKMQLREIKDSLIQGALYSSVLRITTSASGWMFYDFTFLFAGVTPCSHGLDSKSRGERGGCQLTKVNAIVPLVNKLKASKQSSPSFRPGQYLWNSIVFLFLCRTVAWEKLAIAFAFAFS